MFKIGDIIVSLETIKPYRYFGEMFKAIKFHSMGSSVYYEKNTTGRISEFRLATQLEIQAYNQGIRNIENLKQLNYEIY